MGGDDDDDGGAPGPSPVVGRVLQAPRLREFTLAELRAATRGFKPEMVLGEGGFGRVYKGWVDERTRPWHQGEYFPPPSAAAFVSTTFFFSSTVSTIPVFHCAVFHGLDSSPSTLSRRCQFDFHFFFTRHRLVVT